MDDEPTIKRWQHDRRHSWLALKVETPLTVGAALLLWWLSRYSGFFTVLMYIVIGVGAFGFIGDVVNVVHLSRKLKQSEHH